MGCMARVYTKAKQHGSKPNSSNKRRGQIYIKAITTHFLKGKRQHGLESNNGSNSKIAWKGFVSSVRDDKGKRKGER